jgi:hypothetical protein
VIPLAAPNIVTAHPSKRTTTDFCMSPKSEHPDARPISAALGKTPRNKTEKTPAAAPKKTSARKRAPSKSAATEAPEKPTPKPRTRRKVTSAPGAEQHATGDVEGEVRVRAYMLSLARGDGPGSPDADWYQAEREIALIRHS